MQSSLERIDPDTLSADETTGDATLQLHLERYHYAGKYLVKGNCVDIACGTGYGTYLLASRYGQQIGRFTGVDLDADAIARARARYQHPSIDYIVSDATSFHSVHPVQNIVSLETIEHLPAPADFVHQMTTQLEKGGRFISSVPITPSMDANPYHLHDFTPKEFLHLFTSAGYKMIDSFVQVQPYQLFSVMKKKEARSKDLRKGLMGYYIKHPSKFFLRIKSLLFDGSCNKYLVAVFEKL